MSAMTRIGVGSILLAFLALGETADARAQVRVESSVLFESYTFDTGLGYDDASQLSVPFTLRIPLGPRAGLTASSIFTRVSVTPSSGADAVETMSGLTDTELRLSVDIVPERLVFIGSGAIPTGMESIEAAQGPVLGVLVTDVLGFSTRNLGTGGSVGAGFAGGVPAGRMALGLAATFLQFGSFDPVVGGDRTLKPASELRIRGGIEGPAGERGYLRMAAVVSRRGSDEINGEALSSSGNRYVGYVSLAQRLGNSELMLYAFDLYRSAAQLETSALGAAVVPKGNLIAGGAQLTLALARDTRLTPRVEVRSSSQAPEGSTSLAKLGSSVRVGADLRQSVGPGATLVFEANGLVGNIESPTGSVGVTGFRFGAHLQVSR